MNIQPGDKLTVRQIKPTSAYKHTELYATALQPTSTMVIESGQILTVKEVRDNHITVEENGYGWTRFMFEEPLLHEVNAKYLQGEVSWGLIESIKGRIKT